MGKINETKGLIQERIKFCETVLSFKDLTEKQKEEFPEVLYYWKELDKIINGEKTEHTLKEVKNKTVNDLLQFTKGELKKWDEGFEKAKEIQKDTWGELKHLNMTEGEWVDYKILYEKTRTKYVDDIRLFMSVKSELYKWGKTVTDLVIMSEDDFHKKVNSASFYKCPNCNYGFILWKINYCSGCGKKIKWK